MRRTCRAALADTALLVPGVALSLALAAVAMAVAQRVPVVGAPVVAVILGILLASRVRRASRFAAGIAFASRRVLQASVVLLGFGLSSSQVLSVGAASLPVLLGTLAIALLSAWAVGVALGLSFDLRALIGVGTAICGASAIAATDAAIDADEADVSYAIATIFTFNVVAVLLYPTIGHVLGLPQHSFGLWAGTAINDVSSVVAAGTVYGHAAASYGVIVKLTRTLAIVPIAIGLAVVRGYRQADGERHGPVVRPELRRIVPFFVLAFIAAVSLNSLQLVPGASRHVLSDLPPWMIATALAAIGLSTNFGHIRRAGLRPLMLGAILWVTVGLTSLALQALTIGI